MVDHVEFLDPSAVDNFISGWRKTSHQSMAWLIGKYAQYSGVPLGIKGIVNYLWIPLQESAYDGVQLPITDSPWYQRLESLLDQTLSWLELEKIGSIWTDLMQSSNTTNNGSVAKLRGPDSFFVSGWETIWMANSQLNHPIPGMDSTASRWISIIVSGDENEQISLCSYQLSLQATAMAKSNILFSTSQAPYCAIWSTSNQCPLPDLFYRKSVDGNTSGEQCKASPCFPTEYLLVSLTHGFLQSNPNSQLTGKFDILNAFIRSNGDLLSELFLKSILPFLRKFNDFDLLMQSIHSDLGNVITSHLHFRRFGILV